MRLEGKIKQATLTVALKHMLRDKSKCKERACRNIIEFCSSLKHEPLSEDTLAEIYEELLVKIDISQDVELTNWLSERFRLV